METTTARMRSARDHRLEDEFAGLDADNELESFAMGKLERFATDGKHELVEEDHDAQEARASTNWGKPFARQG